MRVCIFIAFATMLFSCNNNRLPIPDTPLSEIYVMDDSLSESLHQHCSLWLNSWERGLKTDSFALVRSYTSALSTDWEEFDISEKYFSDYRDKIFYAPNGSYALDMYSYSLILNKKDAEIHAVVDADV